MKWVYAIKEKYKFAFYLTIVFVAIIMANLFERTRVSQVDQSVGSLYKDRLIPATEIAGILDHFYTNRLLVEEHIHSANPERYKQIEQGIRNNNHAIDTLVALFEQTFLVDQEEDALNTFRSKMAAHEKIQATILAMSRNGQKDQAYAGYTLQGRQTFEQSLATMRQLTAIQANVGKELVNASHAKIADTKVLFNLEIAMALIIGVIAQILIKASAAITGKSQKFRMN